MGGVNPGWDEDAEGRGKPGALSPRFAMRASPTLCRRTLQLLTFLWWRRLHAFGTHFLRKHSWGGEAWCPDKGGVREVRAEKEGNTPTPSFLLISQKPALLGGPIAAEKKMKMIKISKIK